MKKIIAAISFIKRINIFFKYLKDKNVNIVSKIKAFSLFSVGILYLVSPIDFIPDFIFGLGIIDDIFVLTYIFEMLNKQLEDYKRTLKEKSLRIIEIDDYIIKDEN
ncbi:Protein of unknown function [Alkalithermobacter thermoalcaliphilus JW-YL-7 = DSM 7308]|uniref:DUF1232 domain-containing protein n=1 Tax=Alkalithermobacter thermoalcaliphilus JW-YL-7 = DSM 7308 TaxID=1121328 RepID=A0A150FPG5_CLOPD|nr:protein of unknown function DUF1232 [[Clostridium] paradoxum JW-YL-7 = DSM 7308]SHL25725.1 Protein of unknown function [[Clostridium] paradoxum JW-YL-7 = DSM 7308]